MTSRVCRLALLALILASPCGFVWAQDEPGAKTGPDVAAAPQPSGPGLDGSALSIGPQRVYDLLKRGDPSM